MWQNRLTASICILLGLIALVQCVPLEVVYTGDACDCPSYLDTQIHIPRCPKQKKYIPNDYGYKVDVPVQAKAKVSYSFDFTVEEPRTPRPYKPTKWNLYTKVDRISINKPDCETDYKVQTVPVQRPLEPLYPSVHKQRCNCAQCGSSKPLYRYVYKRISPCKCQHESTSKCTCNNKSSYIQNMLKPMRLEYSIINIPNSIRRKRDLRDIFRPRRLENKRLPRFVKQYSKSLLDIKQSYSNFENDDSPIRLHPKRKTKKAFFSSIRTPVGRIRRDIKGEYDLLEKERDQMDLTLPEIIQFMPETLRPTFKRGQCNFGCTQCKNNCNTMISPTETFNVNVAKTAIPSKTYENVKIQKMIVENKATENIMGNAIPVLYKKRDTSNYKQQPLIHQSQIYIQRNPLTLQSRYGESHAAYQPQIAPQTTYQTEVPNLQSHLYKVTPPIQVLKQSSYQARLPVTQHQAQPENIYQPPSLSMPLQQSVAYQAPPQHPPIASQTTTNYQYQTAPTIQPPTRYQPNSQYLNPIPSQTSPQDSYRESPEAQAQIPPQSPSPLPPQLPSTPPPQPPTQNPYPTPSPNPTQPPQPPQPLQSPQPPQSPQSPQPPQPPQPPQNSASQPLLQNTYLPPVKSLPQVPLPNPPEPAKQPNQSERSQFDKQLPAVYDHLSPKYTENNGRLRLLVSALPIPDPTGNEPLHFAGDLEGPSFNAYRTYNPTSANPKDYPIEHISNADLDKIISTIIYRHPDFIDASSHYEGALVDPTPIQEEQTKGFLKKLIDGRLNPVISEPQDHIDGIFDPNYTTYSALPASIFTSLDQIIKLFKGYLS